MLLVPLALALAVQAAPAPEPKADAQPKTTARAQHHQPLMERSVRGGPIQAVLPADGKPRL
mgnify:CR=1 FL=1